MEGVVGGVAEDEEEGAVFDGVDDGTGEGTRQGWTTEAATKATGAGGRGGVAVVGPVDDDGSFTGFVVNTGFKSIEKE